MDVSYTGTQVRMDGELTTHNGSKISLQAKGKNSFFTNPLPENVMSGHIEGTEATYILAYDVKTGKDSRVYVTVMLMANPSVSGLKKSE